ALEQRLALDEWAYGTGVPANAVRRQSDAFTRVEAQAQRFAAGTPAAQLQTGEWTTQEWQQFLAALPDTMTASQMTALDAQFRFSRSGNSEILFAWLQMAVRNHYDPAVPALERFLTSQGRRKFVRPLFANLMEQGEWGQPLARRIYQQARPGYHPVTAGSVDEIVK
ncbi:leukotriene A4 hydrolase C-terminal domain-containing protein, partial [Longimicrobium sp.]|uniref:leukotriene A4 hydrolase C-terminal domain-containing protein n=1 Tax=Longimicrobium sp. TaxID=2029185 RepID=UPI002E31B579